MGGVVSVFVYFILQMVEIGKKGVGARGFFEVRQV